MPVITEPTDVTADRIPSTTDPTSELTAFHAVDAADEMADHAAVAAPAIASHMPITKFRNASQLFHSRMIPAINATIAITTNTTGLAANTALSAPITAVNPVVMPDATAWIAAHAAVAADAIANTPFTTSTAAANPPMTPASVNTSPVFCPINVATLPNTVCNAVYAGNSDSPNDAAALSAAAADRADAPSAVSDSFAKLPAA